MKKSLKSILKIRTLGAASIFGLILISSACNKDFDNVLPTSFKNDTAGLGDGSKKVLYIILDGVRGSVLKTMAPTNITKITRNAMYSYEGLADYRRNAITNASSWTTMLTGVDYTRHNVTAESFAGLNLQATPTIFSRLKTNLGNIRTVSLASTAAFNDNLASDASVKQNLSDDAAVKNAAINELANNNPSVVVAQFHGAELAGAANGYTSSTPAYTSAITTLDGYIGEILTALQARGTFKGENWLVVVSSNKGGGVSGGADGSNIFLDESRNTFVAFYSPKFTSVDYPMPALDALPFAGFGPRFVATTSSNATALLNNTSIGNFGSTGDFTFMFKFRNDYTQANYYPVFLGKRATFNSLGEAGWSFLLGENGFQLDVNGGGRPNGDVMIRDGKWHTVAFTIYFEGAVRRLALFVDGARRNTITVTTANFNNNAPLRIGSNRANDANEATNLIIKDVAMYNIAMSDADVIAQMRKQVIPGMKFFSNMIGGWPGNESSGATMFDITTNGNNFTFNNSVQFAEFSDISPNVSPEISQMAFLAVPNGVDIPVVIYNWMNIAMPSQWNLMGKFYNPTVNLPIN